MITLGIVGGIGSGKSFISSLFKELGAEIIKADEIGHLVLLLPEVQEKLKERWKDIDTTSRREVGRKVFNDLQELGFLEQVTLPYIVDHVKHYQAAGLLMNAEVIPVLAPRPPPAR
jgi:dephospho-CoA kinase